MKKLNQLKKDLNIDYISKKEAIKRCLCYIVDDQGENDNYGTWCEENDRHPAEYEKNAKHHIYAAAIVAYYTPKELHEGRKQEYNAEELKELGLL